MMGLISKETSELHRKKIRLIKRRIICKLTGLSVSFFALILSKLSLAKLTNENLHQYFGTLRTLFGESHDSQKSPPSYHGLLT